MAKANPSPDDYTVAWIAPIEVEQIPAVLMLDTEHEALPQSANDHNVYTLGSINGHNVVIASLPGAGNTSAATVITQMRNTFPQLRFCLLVGIGGGVPQETDEGPIRLGHVVVSKPERDHSGAIQYDHGKLEADGHFIRTGALAPPPAVLLNSAQQMSVRRAIAREDPLITHLKLIETGRRKLRKYRYPGADQDPRYDPNAIEDDPADELVVHRGTIASGERVVKNAEYRDLLGKEYGILCFEMEAAGVLADFPCLVIRGISDYADGLKNDVWQGYAAAAAAAYARELFFHMPVDQVKQCTIPERDMEQMVQNTSRLWETAQDDQIKNWLSPPDPSINYNGAIEKCLEGSGRWFLESEDFSNWLSNPNSALWLHGIPGCGKTFLSCTVIQQIRNTDTKPGSATLYFFFDFSNVEKQSFENMIRSLTYQLCCNIPAVKRHIHDLHEKRQSGQPGLSSLLETFEKIITGVSELTIVLDALDECTTREPLLKWLKDLGCRIFMTSRRLNDIESSILEWDRSVSIFNFQQSPIDQDIRAYVRHRLRDTANSKLAKNWEGEVEVLESIEDKLMKKAGGMFRWAACQLDALEDCEMFYDLQDALDCLPDTLSQTYERILVGIPGSHVKHSTRMLQFLAYSQRPLTIAEAVDILAVTPERVPKFDTRNRMRRPERIIKFCSSLVTVVWGQIHLAHFSVKEYLISSPRESKGPFTKALEGSLAQAAIMEVIYAYMSSLSQIKDLESPKMKKSEIRRLFPFAEYGATYWMKHAREAEKEKSETTQAMVLDFCSCQKSQKICVYLNENDYLPRIRSEIGPSPLYVASTSGLKHTVEGLLREGAGFNEDSGLNGPALLAACVKGHEDVVKLLLGAGTDVNFGRHIYDDDDDDKSVIYITALLAAITRDRLNLVRLLIDQGADLDSECYADGDERMSPLQSCALAGYKEIAQLLLERGADINLANDRGWSALRYAIDGQELSTARLLLDYGADINIKDEEGCSNFEAVCRNDPDSHWPTLIVERGTDIDIHISHGKYGNALQIASLHGCVDVVELLLNKGMDVNAGLGNLGNALYLASSKGHLNVVQLLLERGADVNDCLGEHGNALHIASFRGYEDTVSRLIEKGADPDSLDIHGWNASLLAINQQYEDTAKLLLEKGAYPRSLDELRWTADPLAIHQGQRFVSSILTSAESKNGSHISCLYPSTFDISDVASRITVYPEKKIIETSKSTSELSAEWTNNCIVDSEPRGLKVRSDHPFPPWVRKVFFRVKILPITTNEDNLPSRELRIGLCVEGHFLSDPDEFKSSGVFQKWTEIYDDTILDFYHWVEIFAREPYGSEEPPSIRVNVDDVIVGSIDYDARVLRFEKNGKCIGDLKDWRLPVGRVFAFLQFVDPIRLEFDFWATGPDRTWLGEYQTG